jgi:MFS family permease
MPAQAVETEPPTPASASDVNGARADPAARPSRGGWRQTFASLRNRDFLFLWLGMIAMMGGMQMQMLTRGYLVYDITGSATRLGIVAAGSAVPMLSLALFGGALADRMDRARLIQIGQMIAALLSLAVGIAIVTNVIEWYHLFWASVLQGTTFAFMMPARTAIIPQLVGKSQVTNAMALNAAGMSVMTLLAPALAGGLYAWGGPGNVYFFISGLGLLSVILTSFIRGSVGRAATRKAPMLKEIAAGLSYVRHNRMVMLLIFMGLATALLAMPFRFLMPVFVVDVYHRGPESMGLLVAIMGGGSLAGSLAIAAYGTRRRGLLLLVGSFASGVALLFVALFPMYYAAAAVMLLLGLGDSSRRTLNQSLIMEVTEDQYRGRVMSVFMMNFGLMPLAVLPAGMLMDALGGQVVVGILAVTLLAVTTVVLLTQPRLRTID